MSAAPTRRCIPGQVRAHLSDGEPVGWLGSIHPSLAATLDLPATVQLFELETGPRRRAAPGLRAAVEVSVHSPRHRHRRRRDPGLRGRARCASAAAGDLLRELVLFDLYVGEKVDSGRKSLALGLILQATSQTLTDDDVAAVVERVPRLKTEVGAELRA
jgi:phenylalanyl-tRNA synthetase beta chain